MKNYIPTKEFAKRFCVQGNTVRRGLCINGHYLGIKPLKGDNGRLLWPDVQPEQILNDSKSPEAR